LATKVTVKDFYVRFQVLTAASMTALNKDFYVDDILTGTDTIEEPLELRQLIHMLKKGGFPLRKWCSNHPAVLKVFKLKTGRYIVFFASTMMAV
jgi:hypothetical protein